MKIAICICTFRRPQGLRNALEQVARLSFEGELTVVVADNDAAGEGLEVCNELAADYRWPILSTAVADSGISYSRNAAATLALAQHPDFVAFLDDDEWPEPDWLSELLRVQQQQDADAVGGPTLSVFPENTPESARQNQYFGADLGLPDGSACQLEAAGNFLIRTSTLELLGPEFFHPAFAQSGGEDLAFFLSLQKRDAKMHWATGAIMNESVPADRLSIEWMKQRVIVIANSRVRVTRMLQPGLFAALERVAKTCALFAQALLMSALGLFNKSLAAKAQILRWKFWGKFTAHLQVNISRAEGR